MSIKAVDASQLDADLLSVANAIRTKGGTSAALAFPAGFVQAINDIHTGGTEKTVTIHAPKNSTVSWIGTASGSIQMGSETQASVLLVEGTYTFTDVLTVDGTEQTLYSKTVAVAADIIVQLYPDNALYWYGLAIANISMTDVFSVKTSASGYAVPQVHLTKEDNRLHAAHTEATRFGLTAAIDISSKPTASELRVIAKLTGNSASRLILDSCNSGDSLYNYSTDITFDSIRQYNNIVTAGENYAAFVFYYSSTSSHTLECSVYAILMD